MKEADGQPVLSRHPAHNGTYGRLITASETVHNAGYVRVFFRV